MSNFWIYTVMTIIILHVIIGFIYLAYKLSPPKKVDRKKEDAEKND